MYIIRHFFIAIMLVTLTCGANPEQTYLQRFSKSLDSKTGCTLAGIASISAGTTLLFKHSDNRAASLISGCMLNILGTYYMLRALDKNDDGLEDFWYNFYEIVPGKFYRSAQMSGDALKKYIKRYGIKTIINLRGKQPDNSWWVDEHNATKACNIAHINIPMSHHTLSSKENVATLLNAYATAHYPIMVHCYAGADRTGEATALWLMDQQNLPKEEAIKVLDIKYYHASLIHPAKRFLINLWQGREWALNEYNHLDYPAYL